MSIATSRRNRIFPGLAALGLASALGLAACAGSARKPRVAGSPDLAPFFEEVRALVEAHFPDATATLEGRAIRFESDTRTFLVHRQAKDGEWMEARAERGPGRGGIQGVIELREGPYAGALDVPATEDLRYFRVFHAAPYSKRLDRHLRVELKYSPDAPPEFLEEFKVLVDRFEESVRRPIRFARA